MLKNAEGIEIGTRTLNNDELKRIGQTIEEGNYSNLTDLVSAKEAEVYLHFLESGSTEGMTESELKAVQKIEELIKSNKIDYDGILKIRNETVKSDVEVVRKTTEDSVEDVGKNAAEDAGKIVESGTYSWKIGSTEDAKYIGKGNVGDFSNLEGTTIEDILSRIPEDAVRRELIPEVGKVTEGFEYKWMQDGKTFRVRIHGIDASAPAGSNAANGWVVRVQQGKKYLSPISMEFQPPGITKIDSPYYSEELANSTHIPIQSPK